MRLLKAFTKAGLGMRRSHANRKSFVISAKVYPWDKKYFNKLFYFDVKHKTIIIYKKAIKFAGWKITNG